MQTVMNEIDYRKFDFKSKRLQPISFIGSGGFGTVGKFLDESDQKLYAIKIIDFSNLKNISKDDIHKEAQTMVTLSKVENPFVVQFNNSWIENNHLLIQMECCVDNLRNILVIKPSIFETDVKQAMNSIEYFISCEIFRQITEALNYLHSMKPKPLIHRDLKPENILIGKHGNKSICKLADFGLSKFIEEHSEYHTRMCVSDKYKAPEMTNGQRYDTKIDIWSLGMIGLEIFNLNHQIKSNINIPFSLSRLLHESIDQKLERCNQMISSKLLCPIKHSRISCEELLVQLKKLCLLKNSIQNTIEFKTYQEKFNTTSFQYFHDILSK